MHLGADGWEVDEGVLGFLFEVDFRLGVLCRIVVDGAVHQRKYANCEKWNEKVS